MLFKKKRILFILFLLVIIVLCILFPKNENFQITGGKIMESDMGEFPDDSEIPIKKISLSTNIPPRKKIENVKPKCIKWRPKLPPMKPCPSCPCSTCSNIPKIEENNNNIGENINEIQEYDNSFEENDNNYSCPSLVDENN